MQNSGVKGPRADAFEAGKLHCSVDLMRTLRATQARLHVREEVLFFTGPLVTRPKRAVKVAG
jgi:chlorite dismutase